MPGKLDENYRDADPFGIWRSQSKDGKQSSVLPQAAEKLDASLPIARDELLIEVSSLNIDSASFRQIKEVCGGDPEKIKSHILNLVQTRGKHHNPVTGSGGMLIGKVAQIGPDYPVREKPVSVGDRVASMVSLSLTPLEIRKITALKIEQDRVDIEGHAILFASGIFAKLPSDIPENLALAVLDVAGAPAQMKRLVQPGNRVVVIGGAGKSGLLCLYMAKKVQGVTTIAVDYSKDALDEAVKLGLADIAVQIDARDSVEVMDRVWNATRGKMGDVVVNVANLPETEISSILSAKKGGIVYFFSMATSFQRATLGAEGLGLDVDLRMGNGYAEGHSDLALTIMRENKALRAYFEAKYTS